MNSHVPTPLVAAGALAIRSGPRAPNSSASKGVSASDDCRHSGKSSPSSITVRIWYACDLCLPDLNCECEQ